MNQAKIEGQKGIVYRKSQGIPNHLHSTSKTLSMQNFLTVTETSNSNSRRIRARIS